MGMSYRRAWLLVDSLNQAFREPMVATQHGGSGGGGAVLTAAGQALIALSPDGGRGRERRRPAPRGIRGIPVRAPARIRRPDMDDEG